MKLPVPLQETPDSKTAGKLKPADSEQPPQPAAAPSAGVGTSFIAVRDRYSIYYDRPIPSLDMPHALAFEVEDRKQTGRALYALVCKPEMPVRINFMRALKAQRAPECTTYG